MAAHERPDRLKGRLRRGRLRRLLRRDRRPRRARANAATARSIAASCRSRSWPGATSSRSRAWPAGQAASGAAGDGGKLRLAMRLLHAGIHHVALRGLLPQGPQDRRATRRTALRKSLPLHRLPPDPRRGGRRARATQRRRTISMRSSKASKPKLKAVRYASGGRNFLRPASLAEIVRGDGAIPRRAPDRRRDRARPRDHEKVSQISRPSSRSRPFRS